jgi:hypothetical protein
MCVSQIIVAVNQAKHGHGSCQKIAKGPPENCETPKSMLARHNPDLRRPADFQWNVSCMFLSQIPPDVTMANRRFRFSTFLSDQMSC